MYRIIIFLLGACWPALALTIPGEKAQIKTVGGMEQGVWNLWSDGEWGDFIQIAEPGVYQVEIEARGASALGVWPRVTVNVDGVPVGDLKTASTELKTFRYPLPFTSGTHRLTVDYSNDVKTGNEDRNFYIKQMTITAA